MSAHQIRVRDRVTGVYHGAEFTGVVTGRRWAGDLFLVFHVYLDTSINVYGLPRSDIALTVNFESGSYRGNSIRLLEGGSK